MKLHTLALLTILAAPLACQGPPPSTELPDQLLLLGVDALSAERLEAMFERDELPNLRRIVDQGAWVRARLSSPVEPVSLWTTVLTGRLPQDHRTLGHLSVLPNGSQAVTPSPARKTPHLWQLLSASGVMSAGVGFPATWPAETVNGFLVSNVYRPTRWTETTENTFERIEGLAETYPPLLYEEIKPLIRLEPLPREDVARFFVLTEEEYAMIYDRPLGSVLAHENPLQDIALTMQSDLSNVDIAMYLQETYSPRVVAAYVEILHAAQSSFWPFTQPEVFGTPEDSNRRFRNTVDEAYRFVDAQVGRFLERMTERSVLIVASEHGFTTGAAPAGSMHEGKPFPSADTPASFLFFGNAIRRGVRVDDAQLSDLTPTILALLGKNVANDLQGSVLRAAIEPEFLTANPVGAIASHFADWPPPDRYPPIVGENLPGVPKSPGAAPEN